MPKVRTFFNIPQILEQPVLATQDKKKQGIIQNAKGGMAQSCEMNRIFFGRA